MCVCVCVYTMEIEQVTRGGKDAGGGSCVGGNWMAGFSKGEEEAGSIYLAWEDLTVVLPNFGNGPTRRLLNGLNGYAEPGRIMAIMGPSGSGKSTLLDSLAGRLSGNVVMTGNVLLNGKKKRSDSRDVAYVTQEDTLLGTLTVRETLKYSAHLRIPSSMTNKEIDGIVEEVIMEMGLQECSDTLVGNWHLRGISGGEKKRLSIALEILDRPYLLFLDEPTSGLDSASAFFVIQTLRNIARGGRTVISSIHQPSSEVFALFDDLFLLSNGEAVYFGEARSTVEFFAEAGFPCPSRRNPSDHFLRSINSDFDLVTATLMGSNREIRSSSDSLANIPTAKIRALLVKKYLSSKNSSETRERIRELLALKGLPVCRRGENKVSCWKQLSVLTQRSFINMWRDWGYYRVRIAIYIALSICVGTIFFNVGTGHTAILARGACGGFLSGFMTFMSIGGFPSFIEELKVFCKERLNRHYGVGVYALSNFISSIPYLTVMSLSTAAITVHMVKFRPGFSYFVYAGLDLLASIAAVESCMMTIASLVPNFLTGLVIGAGYIGILMMTSGFFRLPPDLPKVFWRYPISYLNYAAWGLQGAYKNDMIGLEFDSLVPGEPKMEGKAVLKNMLGINVDYSKWWDLAAVVTILVVSRLLFYAILKFKERALPIFRTLYAKRTIRHLKKRASFRKNSPFPSKRHQPIHALSSQEGLNSPLHH